MKARQVSEYFRDKLRNKRLASERSEWLSWFREVCCPDATEHDFLSEAEASAIRSRFYERVKSGLGLWRQQWVDEDVSTICEVLREFGARVESSAVLLETSVGSIEAPAHELLSHAEDLWDPAGRDFALVTRDMQDGLLAERNRWPGAGPRHDKPYFELRAWGAFARDANPSGT